jgi:hypothetical protein
MVFRRWKTANRLLGAGAGEREARGLAPAERGARGLRQGQLAIEGGWMGWARAALWRTTSPWEELPQPGTGPARLGSERLPGRRNPEEERAGRGLRERNAFSSCASPVDRARQAGFRSGCGLDVGARSGGRVATQPPYRANAKRVHVPGVYDLVNTWQSYAGAVPLVSSLRW